VFWYFPYYIIETIRVELNAFLNTKTGSNLYGDPAQVLCIALNARRSVSTCRNPHRRASDDQHFVAYGPGPSAGLSTSAGEVAADWPSCLSRALRRITRLIPGASVASLYSFFSPDMSTSNSSSTNTAFALRWNISFFLFFSSTDLPQISTSTASPSGTRYTRS
jgi:hypothetical protein